MLCRRPWPRFKDAWEQCDQIGRFIGLLGNFSKSLATIYLPKFLTFLGNFVKVSKSLIFWVKSFLGNFYRHLVIFYWSHCLLIFLGHLWQACIRRIAYISRQSWDSNFGKNLLPIRHTVNSDKILCKSWSSLGLTKWTLSILIHMSWP